MHVPLRERMLESISRVAEDGAFVNGPEVARFEQAFASYCGRGFCVGVSSGLDALRLALLAAGVGPGDEVILPAHTFFATAEAVGQVGATPVLVDISAADWNADPGAVEAAMGPATRAVVPVHIYGQLADMEALEPIADNHGADMIADACQAHGAVRSGRRAGGTGVAAAFSFYPTKNLGAFGDAGACVTDSPELASRIRALREHGQFTKHVHELQGFTARLDTIQAAVLLHKLPLLDEWNDQRRAAAAAYSQALDGLGDLRLPPVPAGSEPVWHLYVVRTRYPDGLRRFLAERGIGTGRHYPQSLHLEPALAHLGHRRGEFPVAESLAGECLSLPVFPGIAEEQIEAVVAGVRDYFGSGPPPL